MRASARAFVMEGLVKYHGLRDWEWRIPYHDSISVNLEGIGTVAHVEVDLAAGYEVYFEGERALERTRERALRLIRQVQAEGGDKRPCRVRFENFPKELRAKGLGFSSSMGAALAAALYEAYGLSSRQGWDLVRLSRLARLFSGSASRSVVGGYAKWLAGEDHETSYAVRIGGRDLLDMRILVVPLQMKASTEEAHREAEASPFFAQRVKAAQARVALMEEAIRRGDFEAVGSLAEQDALELHAVTMTGPRGLVLLRPESVAAMAEVRSLREQGTPAYFSLQTGPTVFVNTLPQFARTVEERLRSLGLEVLSCAIGEGVELLSA